MGVSASFIGVTVHRVDATPPQRILSFGTTEPMMVPCGFGFKSNCFLITTRFPAEYTGRLEPQLKSEKRRKEVGERVPEPQTTRGVCWRHAEDGDDVNTCVQ